MRTTASMQAMAPKNVCMIVYAIYPFDNRVRREAETIASCGHFEVTVLCLKETKTARTYVREKVNVRELNVAKYDGHSRLGYALSYARFLIKAFFLCTHLFFRRSIDIVHVHNMPNLLVLAAVVPRLFGREVILDIHDSAPDMAKAKFSGRSGVLFRVLCLEERLSALLSDRVLFVNQVQKEVSLQRGIPSDKVSVFMNVPDHRWFGDAAQQERKQEDLKNPRFNVVYHGTLARRLGVDLAIEAVRQLERKIPEIKLHLWGKGDNLDYLRQREGETGYIELVVVHQVVPIEKLPGALAGMDVGVIPNRKSAATQLMLPVKMMEYIALGIPVVAPKLRAIQHYFTDQMVSFYDPENVEAMADAIMQLYLHKDLRESQVESARGFLDEYGWEKQSVEFINFYLGIANKHGCK